MTDELESRNKVLRAIQNDKKAKELARQIVLSQFSKDVEMQELFQPLMEEVKGMGSLVASEIAWEVFVLIELEHSQGLPLPPFSGLGEELCSEFVS